MVKQYHQRKHGDLGMVYKVYGIVLPTWSHKNREWYHLIKPPTSLLLAQSRHRHKRIKGRDVVDPGHPWKIAQLRTKCWWKHYSETSLKVFKKNICRNAQLGPIVVGSKFWKLVHGQLFTSTLCNDSVNGQNSRQKLWPYGCNVLWGWSQKMISII